MPTSLFLYHPWGRRRVSRDGIEPYLLFRSPHVENSVSHYFANPYVSTPMATTLLMRISTASRRNLCRRQRLKRTQAQYILRCRMALFCPFFLHPQSFATSNRMILVRFLVEKPLLSGLQTSPGSLFGLSSRPMRCIHTSVIHSSPSTTGAAFHSSIGIPQRATLSKESSASFLISIAKTWSRCLRLSSA